MIDIKSQKQIDIMAENGRLLAQIMDEISKRAVLGAKAKELDGIAEKMILKEGATPPRAKPLTKQNIFVR